MGFFFVIVFLLFLWYVGPYLIRKIGESSLRNFCQKKRVITLTYDDGPSETLTPKLLELLNDRGRQATFFLLAHKLAATRTLADQLVCAGHEVGSHSYRHLNAWKKMPFAVFRDIQRGIEACRGFAPCVLFRPPHGKVTLATMLQVAFNRCRHAWWTIDSSDTWDTPLAVSTVVERIRREGGGVILMHDHDRSGCAERETFVLELTRSILELADRENFTVCRMGDLLGSFTSGLEST